MGRSYTSVDERYAVHYREGWKKMGDNPDLPMLTRMVAYAYARTDSLGHARFMRGELMRLLGVNRQRVQKLLDRAIHDGWITDISCSECLVAPDHVSDRRYITYSCPVHEARRIQNG